MKDLNRHFIKEDIKMANKHMKRYSTSLIITKMQIKTTVKKETARSITSHQSEWPSSKKSTNNKCWRGCEEKGTLLLCWECKLIKSLWKRVWRFLKKLKMRPSNHTPGLYPGKTIIKKDTCTPVFIAAGFTIART